jgi:preprotein translocase subunit YajC
VNTIWHSAFILFGQAGDAGAAKPPQGGPEMLIIQLLPFVLIIALFYYMMIRPQRKEQRKRQDMLAAVKKNDRVVTVGGIYGIVMNVHREADEITVKIDETTNTKVRMTLSSIARVVSEGPSDETDSQ